MAGLPPDIHSVWHMGKAPAAATDEWVLVGQDGGQSIDLGDDVLFVFADTLLARPSAFTAGWPEARWPIRRDQGRFVANCCARTERGTLPGALGRLRYRLGPDGWPREMLEATPTERLARIRFWPEHGVVIDGRVFLYYIGIEQVAARETWGFRAIGTGLAVLDPTSGAADRLRWDGDWRLWPPLGDDLHGGVQVVRLGDHVYVFGALREGYRTTARLARVETHRLGEPAAYEYLASHAPAWTRDPSRARDMGPCGGEFSVSFNQYLDGWLMCYVDHDGRSLCLRVGSALWGPYTSPRVVGGLPVDARNDLAGLAFEHPLFSSDGGRTIAVSYCQPNFTQNGLVGVRFA